MIVIEIDIVFKDDFSQIMLHVEASCFMVTDIGDICERESTFEGWASEKISHRIDHVRKCNPLYNKDGGDSFLEGGVIAYILE